MHTGCSGRCVPAVRRDIMNSRAGQPEALNSPPAEPPGRMDWLFRREVAALAWAMILGGLVLPPRGLPLSFCLFHQATGLPCPACGMTRSVTSILHNQWALSWRYHPLGWLMAAAGVFLAAVSVVPEKWKRAIRRQASAHSRTLTRLIIAVFVVWAIYGMARIGLVAAGLWRFPPSAP